jgi:hypothetical protein
MTTQDAYQSKCNQCAKCLGFTTKYPDIRKAKCWIDCTTIYVDRIIDKCLNYRYSQYKLINL